MPTRARPVPGLLPLALAALLLAPAPPARAANTNPALLGGPRHPLPMRTPGAASAVVPPAGAHLDYFGGPVLSSVQVVLVRWGQGTYQPFVTQAAAPSLQAFYAGITGSSYLDWLAEYDTTVPAAGGGPGTDQAIGRGRFVAAVDLVPSPAAAGPQVDDAAIRAELAAQLAAGALPPPATDAAGRVQTLYMISFPRGVTITMGGTSSCSTGGFCAYHGTLRAAGGLAVPYGVLPDMSAGSGCDRGCGNGVPFDDQTSVASHELVEAITNPSVGLAAATAPPLAWYDQRNGEIGDICNGLDGTAVGGDGRSYVVQRQWSNAAGACVVAGPARADDFSLSVAPASRPLPPGGAATFAVSTALVAGAVPAITLAASGLPPGLSAAVAPATVAAGGSALLTVTAAPGAAAGGATLTVTGTAGALTRSATAGVTVLVPLAIAPPAPRVAPRQPLLLAASGGSGTGFTWALAAAPSGGTIDAATGRYQAGATGGTTDVVQVLDSLGDAATAPIQVTAGLSISPASATLVAGAAQPFSASGGSGAGFAWSLGAAPSGGAIDAATGAYRAGAVGGVADEVRVTDPLGNAASASVTVLPPVAVSPAAATVLQGGALAFGASGGSGAGYTWSLAAAPSGGTIDAATGAYRAGPVGGVTDVVQVMDSLGNTSSAVVAVSARSAAAGAGGGAGGGCQSGGPPSLAGLAALLAALWPGRRARPRTGPRAAGARRAVTPSAAAAP